MNEDKSGASRNLVYILSGCLCFPHCSGKRVEEAEFAKDRIKISHISSLPVGYGQSHFTHKHPRLIRDGGNIPPIWTRSEGADTRVVGMVWADHGRAILVRRDSPITSVKQLKGKKIALLRRLPDLIDFYRAMALAGGPGELPVIDEEGFRNWPVLRLRMIFLQMKKPF